MLYETGSQSGYYNTNIQLSISDLQRESNSEPQLDQIESFTVLKVTKKLTLTTNNPTILGYVGSTGPVIITLHFISSTYRVSMQRTSSIF